MRYYFESMVNFVNELIGTPAAPGSRPRKAADQDGRRRQHHPRFRQSPNLNGCFNNRRQQTHHNISPRNQIRRIPSKITEKTTHSRRVSWRGIDDDDIKGPNYIDPGHSQIEFHRKNEATFAQYFEKSLTNNCMFDA